MPHVAKPKRVAVVAYTEYCWDPRVRREAEALVEDGHRVDVIALRPKSGRSANCLEGVQLHEVPLVTRRGGRLRYAYQYTLFFFLSSVLLLRLHFRGRFNLVHVHSLPDFQVLCALPLKMAGVPILLDLHEAMPEIVAARFHIPMESILPRTAALLENLSARFADHVVAANDGIRDAVMSRGIPAEHVTCVYNTSDAPARQVAAEELRKKLTLPEGRILVHAGGINPERDLETLLRAVAQLPAHETLSLAIAGDGEPQYLRSLEKLIESLGIANRVMFVGRLPMEEARALMSLSEVGVITLEASPLTNLAWPTRIAEFADLSKPLVVPRLRFLRSTLQDGAHYYVPGDPASLAQEIEALLREPEKAGRAAAKARQVCGRFEWSMMRTVLLGIYHSLEAAHGS